MSIIYVWSNCNEYKEGEIVRIGIFTDTYSPHINGVATSILMLENALRKLGHKVFIVTVNPDEL